MLLKKKLSFSLDNTTSLGFPGPSIKIKAKKKPNNATYSMQTQILHLRNIQGLTIVLEHKEKLPSLHALRIYPNITLRSEDLLLF